MSGGGTQTTTALAYSFVRVRPSDKTKARATGPTRIRSLLPNGFISAGSATSTEAFAGIGPSVTITSAFRRRGNPVQGRPVDLCKAVSEAAYVRPKRLFAAAALFVAWIRHQIDPFA